MQYNQARQINKRNNVAHKYPINMFTHSIKNVVFGTTQLLDLPVVVSSHLLIYLFESKSVSSAVIVGCHQAQI